MLFQDLINWMVNLSASYGYLGIFLVSLIGSLSIFFPIPSTIVIFALGEQFEPFWIAIAAGIGSAVGEFSGYLIGFGSRKTLGARYKKKMDFLIKIFERFGSIVIFLFALTPLPDDLLFIPLGVMRYNILKAFIPSLLGKFCMNFIVAYSGRFSILFIRDLFGVENDWISALIGTIVALILFAIILILMVKIDWEQLFNKYVLKDETQTAEE